MPPVHAVETDRAVGQEADAVLEDAADEAGEFRRRHLACTLEELAVANRAVPRHEAVDGHVVGKVRESHRGPFVAEQGFPYRGIGQLDPLGLTLDRFRNRQIQVGSREPGDLEVAAFEQERQLLAEQVFVPPGELRDPILGESEGAAISVGQKRGADDRDFR